MDINEQIIKKTHPHFFYFLDFYFGGIVFVVAGFFFLWIFFVVGFLVLIFIEIIRRAETFYILEDGVAREYKLLSTSREFCEYEKIQNTKVNQSFLDNILGIGKLHLDTAGSDKTEVNFYGIKNPYGIEKIIREKMKQKLG